jgi:hypothetical protein
MAQRFSHYLPMSQGLRNDWGLNFYQDINNIYKNMMVGSAHPTVVGKLKECRLVLGNNLLQCRH